MQLLIAGMFSTIKTKKQMIKNITLGIVFNLMIGSFAIAQIVTLNSEYTGFDGYFTDLIEFDGSLICVFREGQTHVSRDGKIAIIRLVNGSNWREWSRISTIEIPFFDLRDPKIIKISESKLMLIATGVYPKVNTSNGNEVQRRQTYYWESDDGFIWDYKGKASDVDLWLWSLHKNDHGIYSVSYSVGERANSEGRKLRLHKFESGEFNLVTVLDDNLLQNQLPSEAAITTINDRMVMVIRRERGNTVLGVSDFPFHLWDFRELPVNLQGPELITVNNKILLAARDIRGNDKFMPIMELLIEQSNVRTRVRVNPKGADFSYAGLEFYNEHLCMSYYNDGKIYFIGTKIPLND